MDNINRLLSGICIVKVQDQIVHINPFPVDKKTEADFFANELYQDLLISGRLSSQHIDSFLIENGLWSDEMESDLETTNKQIEQMKVDYYNNFYRKEFNKTITRALNVTLLHRDKMLEQKCAYHDKTCEYIRDYYKTLFLLKHSSYINGQLINDNFNLLMLMSAYSQQLLKEEEVRGIAKSSQWRTLWGAAKGENVFRNSFCDLTNEQITLISWSRFYDNIQESMERPSDEVIQDDTALDGWAIVQSRKRIEEEKKQAGQRLVSEKMQGAGEVIIPARNQREIEEINALNDTSAKQSINMMRKDLEKHGRLDEKDLSYTRQQIQMKTNSMSRRNNG